MKSSSRILVIILSCVVASCALAPSEDDIRRAITDYFYKQGYSVVDLRIGRIEGVGIAEKTYMGTPGYVVEIPTITIEAQRDKGPDVRRGNRLTFSDARIKMRQDTADKSLWHVSIISGPAVY